VGSRQRRPADPAGAAPGIRQAREDARANAALLIAARRSIRGPGRFLYGSSSFLLHRSVARRFAGGDV
jgi:hypothetical protein